MHGVSSLRSPGRVGRSDNRQSLPTIRYPVLSNARYAIERLYRGSHQGTTATHAKRERVRHQWFTQTVHWTMPVKLSERVFGSLQRSTLTLSRYSGVDSTPTKYESYPNPDNHRTRPNGWTVTRKSPRCPPPLAFTLGLDFYVSNRHCKK